MIQCHYCGRWCGCRYNDPCVCPEMCPDCDVKPDEEPTDDYDDGGES